MKRKLVNAGLAVLSCAAAFNQSAIFEVASVRPSLTGDGHRNFSISTNGGGVKLAVQNQSLAVLIQKAYSLKEYQISGPEWIRKTAFDIVATLPPQTPPEQTMPALQALLAERFKLAFHKEKKELPIYALVVGKTGPKLRPPADSSGVYGTWDEKGQLTGKNETMAHFADVLSTHVDRPVVDMTRLDGGFDFVVKYAPIDGNASRDDSAGQSLFTALQDALGLKLEARRGQVETLVIDHVDRTPAEN